MVDWGIYVGSGARPPVTWAVPRAASVAHAWRASRAVLAPGQNRPYLVPPVKRGPFDHVYARPPPLFIWRNATGGHQPTM